MLRLCVPRPGGGSEEIQEASGSTTLGSKPGKAIHPGAEKGQGEPCKDGKTSTTAGAPGNIDPSTETSARHKQADEAEEWG